MHHILSFSKFGKDKIDKESSNKLKNYFEKIYKSGHHLLSLLNDLLDLSKLEAGRMEFKITKNSIIQISAVSISFHTA